MFQVVFRAMVVCLALVCVTGDQWHSGLWPPGKYSKTKLTCTDSTVTKSVAAPQIFSGSEAFFRLFEARNLKAQVVLGF